MKLPTPYPNFCFLENKSRSMRISYRELNFNPTRVRTFFSNSENYAKTEWSAR